MELIDNGDLTIKNISLKIQKITALIERLTKARDNKKPKARSIPPKPKRQAQHSMILLNVHLSMSSKYHIYNYSCFAESQFFGFLLTLQFFP